MITMPSITGNVLHRVADKTAEVVRCHFRIQAVYRALHEDMPCIIGHRIVPPVESRSLDPFIEPLHGFLGKVTANDVTCPEDLH